jgi:HEAT repeat protein
MRRHFVSLVVSFPLLCEASAAGAQTLSQRIAAVRDGTVQLTYAARPGLCGDGRESVQNGRVIVVFPSMFGYGRSNMRVCYTGPVRVAIGRSDGETISIRTQVGGQWSSRSDATDLETVSAPEAARYLLRESRSAAGRNGEEALAAAVFADSVELWPDLVQLARDRDVREGVRQRAVFWLGTYDAPGALRDLHGLAADDALDEDVRGAAIIALGRDDLSDEDVAWLRRLYPSLSSKLKDNVFLAVSRSESPRASAWLRQIVTSNDESEHTREQALFWLGQGVAPTADLVGLYGQLDKRALRTHYTFVLSQRRDREALDKLIDIAVHDQDRDVRKQALFWLGQSKDPRALEFLRDLVTR